MQKNIQSLFAGAAMLMTTPLFAHGDHHHLTSQEELIHLLTNNQHLWFIGAATVACIAVVAGVARRIKKTRAAKVSRADMHKEQQSV